MKIFLDNTKVNGITSVKEYVQNSCNIDLGLVQGSKIQHLSNFEHSDNYVQAITSNNEVYMLKVVDNTEDGITFKCLHESPVSATSC